MARYDDLNTSTLGYLTFMSSHPVGCHGLASASPDLQLD